MSSPKWLPGLGAAAAIAGFTTLFPKFTGMRLFWLDPITNALLLGVLVRNLMGDRKAMATGIRVAAKTVLSLAVVLLGSSLDLLRLTSLSWKAGVGIVAAMTFVIALGPTIGQLLGMRWGSAFLIASGTAICGSSAIAAVAPLVPEAEEADVGISVAVVNLLGAMWMVVLPPIFMGLHIEEDACALLLGGSLQAVGHVVGAAGAISDTLVESATAVKMGRVALLIPFVLLLGLRTGRSSEGGTRPKLPLDLIGFLIATLLFTAGLLPAPLVAVLKTAAKWLLTIAMAGIGMSVRFSLLKTAGPRGMLLGLVLFLVHLGVIAGALFL